MEINLTKAFQHNSLVSFSIAVVTTFGLTNLGAGQSYDLIHQIDSNQTLNIQTQLQYSGSVIVDSAGKDENARVLPLDVRARLNFDQRISSGSSGTPQAIRYYDDAVATIKAGKGTTDTNLAKSNRLVLSRLTQEKNGTHQVQIASVQSTLSQKEYELLKTPGDSLAFTDLFNKKEVVVGDKWQLEKNQVADLVSVNRVITSSVSMMLKSVEGNTAKIYVYGRLKGEADDAITEMNLKGIALLDLDQKLVTSFRLTIDEDRRTGQVAPGFEGKIKLDSRIAKTTTNDKISRKHLAELYKGKKVKFSFLLDRENSDFKLLHDTRWRIIASEKEAAVLRLVDDGQLIAQCNVVQLPKRPADNPLTLPQFQEEIRKITLDAEATISASRQFTTAAGLTALHVAVDGMEQGIPFSWLYYHVSASDGRRVTFVFTHEKDASDYFESADQQLVNNLVFKAARQASRTGAPATKLPVRK